VDTGAGGNGTMESFCIRNALLKPIFLAAICGTLYGQTAPQDLVQLKLEDLMNIEVTSVSKKEQKMSRTAAAVFVITAEDIRRSGANSIPDLLRMVPGVEVAQINGSECAITVRGFNGQYSNKLLVLVDGRTVYSPMFSGVYWDEQDLVLADIERIEVIRGPGATVWGANAVNGVINIITKKAGDTQGGVLTTDDGSYEHGSGNMRYGGKLGSRATYRVFGKGFNRASLLAPDGSDGRDDWNMVHGGFRIDGSASDRDTVTLQGEGHSGNAGEIVSSIVSISPPVNGLFDLRDRYSGWNLLSRWNHVASPHSDTSLQIYFDRSTRTDSTYGFGLNSFDVDFQHHVGWGARQDLVWGAGYRLNSDTTNPTPRIAFTPAGRTTHLLSSFIQDEITVRPERLFVSLGTKLEHNAYTGFELEPSARVAWIPNDRNTFWAAVSRAQRTPSREDTGVEAHLTVVPGPGNLPLVIGYAGNPNQKSEHETSVEAGYRAKLSNRFALDATVFFNHYAHLFSVEPGTPVFEADPPHLVLLNTFDNLSHGETHGVEMFADWKVASRWTLNPGYSFLTMHIHRDPGGQDELTGFTTEGTIPNHQAQLRSQLYLRRQWQWNTSAYFVARLPYLAIPSYTRVDSNLIWQVGERFSVSLVGQNLLRERHQELSGPSVLVQSDLIKRSAYVNLTWFF